MLLASSIPISLLGTQQKLLPFTESSMVRLRSAEIYQSGTQKVTNLNEYAFRFAVTQNFCPAGKFGESVAKQDQCTACTVGLFSTHGSTSCKYNKSTCPSGTAALEPSACVSCAHRSSLCSYTCPAGSGKRVSQLCAGYVQRLARKLFMLSPSSWEVSQLKLDWYRVKFVQGAITRDKGNTVCTKCNAGMSNSQEGQTSCLSCPLGFTDIEDGSKC